MNKERVINYLLLIFWMMVIFYLSSQPDLKSGLENQMDFILRKLAHVTEYGVLTFLAWRAASDGGAEKGLKYLLISVGFSVFYAISDEYHQSFVLGRVGSSVDILIDSVGILIAAVMVLNILAHVQRKNRGE